MSPQSATQVSNIQLSFETLTVCESNSSRAIKESLRSIPIGDYLRLLPDHASQRVFIALIARVANSKSFMKRNF
jgi:hypothetical protein